MSLSPDHISPNEPDAFGIYPVQIAMSHDDPDMVKLVIDTGADPNINLGQGWTPLHEAIDYAIDGMIQKNREAPYPEALEIIKILIESGADLHKKNQEGKTLLDSLNTYAATMEGFNALKNMFRSVIPSINDLIAFKSKR